MSFHKLTIAQFRSESMPERITLKYRMILGGVAAVIIPFFIAGVVIYIRLSRSLLEMSKEKVVHLAGDISATVDQTLAQEIKLASAIAAIPDVVAASVTGDYRAAQKVLESIHQRIGRKYFTIFLLDRSGIARAEAFFRRQIGLDLSTRDYFQNAKKGRASVGGPFLARGSATPGEPILVVAAPIWKNNTFCGMVGLPFNTDFLAHLVSAKKIGKTGYAFILNDEGLILAHPRKELILKLHLLDQPGTAEIQKVLAGEKAGAASYRFEGVEKIVGLTRVNRTGWTVAFSQRRDEAIEPVNGILLILLASGVFFLVLTVAGIVFFFGRISTPIQKIMALMTQVTHHSTEMILQIGLDRKIIYANDAFEKITGQKIEEVIHREPILDNTGNTPPDVIWESLESGTPWSGRVVVKEADPEPVTLDVMLVPLRDDKGVIQGYLEIGRDVTAELMSEKRLHQAQKLEAIGTLASGIAHDFNNILSGIFGYAELVMMQGRQDPDTERNIRQIMKAAERARDLVGQILTFSRQTEVELRPLQPKKVLKDVLKLLRASIPATIDIQTRIESDAAVLAEPTQIHQIVMNLVTNAVHSMEDKAGVVRVDLMDFFVDDAYTRTHPNVKEGDHILFRVSDTGDGMDPEIQEKVFEPFFTTKPQGKGTGLGLSVVHGIVKKLGGTVSVYSERGKGTAFSILVPCAKGGHPVDSPRALSPKRGDARVMVIDDEPDIATILQSILSNFGYRVTAFTDGRAALDRISSSPGDFDLIITDYTMPQITGLEIARHLKNIGIEIPVILTSGYIGKEIEAAARNVGVRILITKPVNTYRLADAMHEILKRS